MNVSVKINQVFNSHWTKQALITNERFFTYQELYAHANAIRAWLITKNCQKGDVVVLRLPNGWPFAVAYLACILGNYKLVPVNIELSEDDQQYIINRVNAHFIIDDELILINLKPIFTDAPYFENSKHDIAAVFFTSGTTGRPKGVCHTLESLVGNVIAFNRSQNIDSETRLYHILPMAYMAGFLNTLLSPWLAGGAVVLGSRFRPTDALQFWKQPIAFEVNTIWLTPTLAAILVKMNKDSNIIKKLSKTMRYIFCGTAPLSIELRESFLATFGCYLQESYGMSEVLLVAAQTKVQAKNQVNVGCLLPGINVKFRSISEINEPELIIYTPYALISYLVEEGEKSPLLADGGMPSGDLGKVVDDSLIITGRFKDLIIRGGTNISPVSIENFLQSETGIKEVAVIGLPHDVWGESIVACLVAGKGMNTNKLQERLYLRCKNELAEGMRPDNYVWLNELPRSSTGKVQKHTLIKQLL